MRNCRNRTYFYSNEAQLPGIAYHISLSFAWFLYPQSPNVPSVGSTHFRKSELLGKVAQCEYLQTWRRGSAVFVNATIEHGENLQRQPGLEPTTSYFRACDLTL